MKKSFILFLLSPIIFSCKVVKPIIVSEAKPAVHPEWMMQGNIYEVNVRQYTLKEHSVLLQNTLTG
jgi:hypothetical protein